MAEEVGAGHKNWRQRSRADCLPAPLSIGGSFRFNLLLSFPTPSLADDVGSKRGYATLVAFWLRNPSFAQNLLSLSPAQRTAPKVSFAGSGGKLGVSKSRLARLVKQRKINAPRCEGLSGRAVRDISPTQSLGQPAS
jgi:hypothetical protein